MKRAIPVYFLGASGAFAHGGHEEAVLYGDAHWLTSGDHVIVLALACFAAGLAVRPVLRRLRAALIRA